MSQVDFFLCREEKIELADLAIKSGLHLIPDISYEKEVYKTIYNTKEYEDYANRNSLIFFVNKTLDHPLIFGSFEKEGERKYFIRQRYGGPTIDFYSPGLIETEKRIGPGFIGMYSYFYDHRGDKFYPSQEDRLIFKTLSARVKRRSKPVKLKNRTYWIGEMSIALCRQSGYQLIDINGKDPLAHL